jgi:IS30 family transposase
LKGIIGEIKLCETNNDRSANGSLNNCMFSIEHWKIEYGNFENLPFRKINSGLNSSPNKMLKWKYPKEVMNEIIKAYVQQRVYSIASF